MGITAFILSMALMLPGVDSAIVASAADKAVAEKVMASLEPGSTAEMTLAAAKRMLGTPYVGGLLDEGENEEFRLPLDRTDCIIFVETCLNLARTAKEHGPEADFGKFASRVRQMRYRDGIINGYASRIHYTAEWIRQGERLGILKDVTLESGGCIYDHPVSFMSSHPGSYPHINDDNIHLIKEAEDALNAIPYTCIQTSDLQGAEKFIRDGDIICFVSKVEGLDISHVAIACLHDGKVGFIHASSTAGKVVVDERSISEYVRSRPKSLAGIKIVRPL
ncbi:MAG: DUF1460 domain-containing protein [Bacteroidales bacterium]|nr:DUF1460 domain-containing protein [Bacteroidales bacterium]